MKRLFLLMLFVTAVGSAQDEKAELLKAQFGAFKAQMDAYESNPIAASKKPAGCKEYKLKFIVKGHNFDEVVIASEQHVLCEDIELAETSNKNPDQEKELSYDIKAVGEMYYVVRIDKKVGTSKRVSQEFHYYERISKKG